MAGATSPDRLQTHRPLVLPGWRRHQAHAFVPGYQLAGIRISRCRARRYRRLSPSHRQRHRSQIRRRNRRRLERSESSRSQFLLAIRNAGARAAGGAGGAMSPWMIFRFRDRRACRQGQGHRAHLGVAVPERAALPAQDQSRRLRLLFGSPAFATFRDLARSWCMPVATRILKDDAQPRLATAPQEAGTPVGVLRDL